MAANESARAADLMRVARCPGCGYALSGLSAAGCCPECGVAYDTGQVLVIFGFGAPKRPRAEMWSSRAIVLMWIGLVPVTAVAYVVPSKMKWLIGFVAAAVFAETVRWFGDYIGLRLPPPAMQLRISRRGVALCRRSDRPDWDMWHTRDQVFIEPVSNGRRRLHVGGNREEFDFDCDNETAESIRRRIEAFRDAALDAVPTSE